MRRMLLLTINQSSQTYGGLKAIKNYNNFKICGRKASYGLCAIIEAP